MRARHFFGAVCVVAAVALPEAALADSTGTVPGLRAQVTRLITAELHHDAGTVCAILNAPFNATRNGKTCTQRWTKTLKHRMASAAVRQALHADMAAVSSAAVTSDGIHASIVLPHPLLLGQSKFYWTDNCWMLM
jgi:hypothetical protein